MEETAGSSWYRATVHGKKGHIRLMLGSAASDEAPTGYTQVLKGTDYAVYYIVGDDPLTQAVEQVPALDSTQPMYNSMGQRVNADYKGVIIQNGNKYINQ
jgi:hypothetical protein